MTTLSSYVRRISPKVSFDRDSRDSRDSNMYLILVLIQNKKKIYIYVIMQKLIIKQQQKCISYKLHIDELTIFLFLFWYQEKRAETYFMSWEQLNHRFRTH